MFSKIVLLMTAAAVAVHAQDASTTASAPDATSSIIASLSPCIVACIGPAAQANGCSFTDPSCVCASAQFVTDATACLQEHCTPADLAAAIQLQTSQCAAASITPTGTPTTTNTFPFSLSSGSASQTGSASASTTGSANTSASAASSSATSPSTSASTTPSSAAGALVANSGAAAFFGAILAGIVAL
uniref:CFEM domain-containing protein n=1 Tax=Psilocybe cubensis TaxID=181762 RepID=A0A8H7Y5U2_PSICU